MFLPVARVINRCQNDDVLLFGDRARLTSGAGSGSGLGLGADGRADAEDDTYLTKVIKSIY